MEDIDKNADGFIDLEEYIGKFLLRSWEALEDICSPIEIIYPIGQLLAH